MSIQVAFEAVQLTNGKCAVVAISTKIAGIYEIGDVCVAIRDDLRKAVRLARKLNDIIDAEGGLIA